MVASIAARTFLAAVTLLLLVSWGGAIFASPILLPLLFLAAVVSGRPARALFSFLGGMVAAEAVWALVYLLWGEAPVTIWAAPLAAFGAVTTGYFYFSGLGRDSNEVISQHS